MDYKKIVKLGYDKCAQNYLDERDPFKNQKYLIDLTDKLTEGSNVLDIGCGAGYPIDRFLIDKGHRVTGIDISPEQIRLAQKNNPEVTFLVKDMSEINFQPNLFDAIVSFYAIFHIKREDHQALFDKLFLMLKPEGYLLVTMGASDWEGTEEFHGVNMFWSHYDKNKSLEIIKNSGFKIIYGKVDTSGGEKHLVVFAQKS